MKNSAAPASAASNYIGRFAPSPTGPLHLGSLVAALASFLDAKANQGQWLLRMEDIDPPREQPGASDQILSTLERHGLAWDGEVWFQSTRTEVYRQALQSLRADNRIYACSCSRQRLSKLTEGYDGFCLNHPPIFGDPAAWKFKVGDFQFEFADRVQGQLSEHLLTPRDDFVLWRKDDLVAYQLAVVVDDLAQGVTHVVRGSDLLDSTARQACLITAFGATPPQYCHVPVVVKSNGQKLSKQNHARAIDDRLAAENLYRALQCLQQRTESDLVKASPEEILAWAISQWDVSRLPRQLSVELCD